MISKVTYTSNLKTLVNLFWIYFFVTIPGFIAIAFYSDFDILFLYNFFESIFFCVLIILFISVFKNSRVKKIIYYFLFSSFVFCSYIEAVYFVIYGTYFSPSSVFLFFDSNPEEATEFLTFYFSKSLLIFTVILLIVYFLCLKQLQFIYHQLPTFKRRDLIKSFVLMVMLLGFMRISKLIDYNFPYLFLRSFIIYQNESKEFDVYKNNKNGNFKNVKKIPSNHKEVYVLVLGESTTKSHLGIYGYDRPTTPHLRSKKEELLLYQNVISPHTYSVGSVTKLLTLANYENPKVSSQGSIFQLLNALGFETFWLSNQRPLGPYESLITKLSASADYSKFITTAIAQHSKTLDEALLTDLEIALKESQSNKIFILLHLIGTHHDYEDRYTDSFNIFNGDVNSNYKSKESKEKINHYDNAVLYNDFVVNAIIEKVKSTNTNSFVLYLSDHGEELYRDRNMAGHNEDTPTQLMYEIPFMLWQSEKYKNYRSIDIDINRRYMTDDLFHSLADLMGIQSDRVNYKRSIFSNIFEERKRIVLDSIDYDTAFKSKE
jgi:heptose-I-phosphate ethanolaminephosphotransferase